ncbi:hypothetical protein [Flavobacterium sp. CS20]|nr:hypothetical protein [Flavobacterium sp. CS20]
MSDELSQGHIVYLGDLGSFRVSLSSEGFDLEEDVSSNAIKDSKILFRPGKRFRDLLKTLEFKKVD